MKPETLEPKIYVASLAAYNSGIYHGEWIDTTLGEDHVRDEIQRILSTCPEKGEEYAIHDFEYMGSGMEEYTSIEEVCVRAKLITKYGSAFLAYLDTYITTSHEDWERDFENRFHGEHESKEAFAEERYWDTHGEESIPAELLYHIDWTSYARALFREAYDALDNPQGYNIFVFSKD